MSSLLTEYRKRHRCDAIWPANDGVCFFDNILNRPSLIALCSLPCRAVSTCIYCEDGTLALELFGHAPNRSYDLVTHRHIKPDSNLLNVIREDIGYPDAIPFAARDNRDVEVWLWRFFENGKKPVRIYSTETNPELRTLEEMAQCAIKHPRTFAAYYSQVQAFVIARKYLLYL